MKKDAIIILGNELKKNSSLSELCKMRVRRGVELFNKSKAKNIICCGYYGLTASNIPIKSEAKAMKEYAISIGIPSKIIFLEDKSKETIGNIYLVKDNLLEKNNWKDILIITSDFHLKRTKYIVKRVLGKEYRVEFIGVPSNLTKKQLVKRNKMEKKFLTIDKLWLNFIKKQK